MNPAARKQKILAAVVEGYIATGEPVGSKALAGEPGLSVSSATVRNDMAELTAKGYLRQPHTSAGRIPTPAGYRFYIDNLMEVTPLAGQAMSYIRDCLRSNSESPESILQGAADLLSRLTDCPALSTTPGGDDVRVRRISFLQTGPHTAMAVLMASDGIIKTRLFRCEFVITPELLEVFDKAMRELFEGIPLSSINRPFIQTAAARFGELSLFMPSALMAVHDAARQACAVSVRHSGYIKLMRADSEQLGAARGLIEYLQNESDLAVNLERLPLRTAVTLGRENSRVELGQSAVISTRYRLEQTPSGVLAVIAPMRTDYARTIAILEGVAQVASELMDELTEPQEQ